MHQALSREGRPSGEPENHPRVRLTPAEAEAVFVFLAACFLHEDPTFEGPCLNPDENWEVVERDYFASRPEIVVIDDFLAEDALRALREFSLASTVWKDEYPHRYLGAFAASGFVSKLHLRIAVELREKLPRILGAHGLQELWGFKYDPRTEKGIDVHADFAVVNLNFWITPDEFNLDPASGGLKIYDVPAPPDWSFDRYNEGGDLIHRFLAEQRASCRTVRHRCNRAVLFNSALFHETDAVHFRDLYEGRRINLTYLFGRQLRAD